MQESTPPADDAQASQVSCGDECNQQQQQESNNNNNAPLPATSCNQTVQMQQQFACKKILVTGGAGLIGRQLCEYLSQQGHSVACLDDFSNSERLSGPLYEQQQPQQLRPTPLPNSASQASDNIGDTNNNNNNNCILNNNNKKIKVYECNLCNKDLTVEVFCMEKPDIVFHLACHAYEVRVIIIYCSSN